MTGIALAISKGIGTVFFGAVCFSSFFLTFIAYRTMMLYRKELRRDKAALREWYLLTLIALLGLLTSASMLYDLWF